MTAGLASVPRSGGGNGGGGPPAAPRDLLALVREHAGTSLTLAYLAVTGVGMLSSWALYQRLGINIFRFAQVQDFLLAATATPRASLSMVLALLSILLIRWLDLWSERFVWYDLFFFRSERIKAWMRSWPAWLLYFALYAQLAASLHARWFVTRLERGEGDRVVVQLQAGTWLGRDATRPFAAQLVGTTTSYVFLYDRRRGQTTAVPIENLTSLSPVAGRAPAGAAPPSPEAP